MKYIIILRTYIIRKSKVQADAGGQSIANNRKWFSRAQEEVFQS